MVSLEEILETRNIILLDTSACSYCVDFTTTLKNLTRYDHIKRELIEQESKKIDGLMSILLTKSTRTIPEITEELNNYMYFLKKSNKKFFENEVKGEKGRENQRILRQLYEKSRLIVNASRKKELIIDDPRYDVLTQMMVFLSNVIPGLKKDSFTLNGENNRSKYSTTDEKLVAASYYLSFNYKNNILITADRDYERLFDASSKLMGSDELLPYNNQFRNKVKDPFVQLYLLRGDNEYKKIRFRLRKPHFPKNFEIDSTPNKSEEIKKEMLKLWKKFDAIQ